MFRHLLRSLVCLESVKVLVNVVARYPSGTPEPVGEPEAPRSFHGEPKTRTVAGVRPRIVQGWERNTVMTQINNALAEAIQAALHAPR